MIGPRKRREIVGTFAKMYDHRFMAEFHAEHERHVERDALDLCGDLDRDVVQMLKTEAQSNYAALAEDQDRREKRRR
jgi:hypothetical protein